MAKKKSKENLLFSDIAYDDAFRTMETECDDLLIPFYIFNYEKELTCIDADTDRTEAMVGLYRDIVARLDEEQAVGRLSSLSYGVIIRLTHKVIYKFLMKHSKV